MGDNERLVAYFSGHVQGVGFRFTVMEIAEGFTEITGYVRNLPDRRVELVAEGGAKDLQIFLAAIERQMGQYIRGVAAHTEPATGEFKTFMIER